MLVERQVGDQGFQLAILFAQLLKLAQLVQGKPSVFPLPAVKRLLGHAHFPANIADLLPRLDLPQGQDDLLFAMPFSRHSSSPRFRSEDHIQAPVSTFPLSHFRVLGQRTGAQLTGCLNLRGRSERQSVPNAGSSALLMHGRGDKTAQTITFWNVLGWESDGNSPEPFASRTS